MNISKYKNSVVENQYNTSDHCALLLELSIDNKENAAVSVEIEEKTVNNINWNNMNIVQEYSNKANEELRKVRFNNAWSNDDNIQESVDELYNKITYALRKANQETIDQYYSKKFKRKVWWNAELEELKNLRNEARNNFKMWHKECDREKIKELKKEFRRVQRRSQFVFEEKKCRNIEKSFEIKKKKSSGNPLIIIKMGKIKNCWMKIIKKY